MTRLGFIILLLLLSLSTLARAQIDTLPDGLGKTISTAEGLRQIVESKDARFVIIDVRPPTEYAAGHIPTAINIPGGLTADMTAPPSKDRYLILYCLGGMRSPSAGERMLADGYKYVFVWGGITKWPYAREVLAK